MTRVHLSLLSRPGRREELLAALDRLELAVASDDAYLMQVELLVPLDHVDRVLVVSTWPSAEHYERWQNHGEWERIRRALEPLLVEEPEVHVYRLVDSIR